MGVEFDQKIEWSFSLECVYFGDFFYVAHLVALSLLRYNRANRLRYAAEPVRYRQNETDKEAGSARRFFRAASSGCVCTVKC